MMSLPIKVMFIDVGKVVPSILMAFKMVFYVWLPHSQREAKTDHISYVVKAFLDEYENGHNIQPYFCGFDPVLTSQTLYTCAKYALNNGIKYINISYGPSELPYFYEHDIIKKLINNGVSIVYAQGNKDYKNIDEMYPIKYCLLYDNCHIALAKELIDNQPNFTKSKKAVVLPSLTCINNKCMIGSSFAAPKLLAKIIKAKQHD